MNEFDFSGNAKDYSGTDPCCMTMDIRRGGAPFFALSLCALRRHCSGAFQNLISTAFLLAVLSVAQAAKAQDKMPTPPPLGFAENAELMDTAELQQQRFLHSVAQAVIHLEANGDRTMDAIENSQITLTLDTIEDSSSVAVLCNDGGKALNVFAQSLAGGLQLNGRVSEAVCVGAGHDDDPFVMKFRLHYESGRTSLFYEQPPMLPFIVEKPVENELAANAEIVDRGETSQKLAGDEPEAMPSEPPQQPAILNPRRSQASHTVVQLPQGWTPVKLPDPKHTDSVFGTSDSSVTFADGTLTVNRKLVIKRDKVEVVELPAFEKWKETVEGGTNVALRSTLYYPDRDASAGTEEQKKAAEQIDEAYRDIQAHEFVKAEAALDQAQAIDPGHEILHEDRGELAAARGDYATALAEYRKELELFPNALFEMGSIAEAQGKLGDIGGAITTLQRWMLADHNSNFAASALMEYYHKMGRDDLSVSVGDDAMNTMTRDARRGIDFLLTYGHEQMLTGQSRGAESTLKALLDLTVDDRFVNDAAYYLSEQGLSLDRAEQSVRDALTEFDPGNPAGAVSTSYVGDTTDRTNLLLDTWDTLGWILYRKGAVQEAEGYVRAAWRSTQDIAICRHLGEILTAEDKPVEAMDVYTLGLALSSGANAAGLAKNPDAIAVRDALARLKRKGNSPTVTDAKAALVALRTLDLGPAVKPHGAQAYTVTWTAYELVSYTPARDEAEQLNLVVDNKLLAGFFPPDSKAALTRKGMIECRKTCSLVFTP